MRSALEHAGMEVVAEVTNGPDALRATMATRPDVALIDVNMPGGSGIDAAAEIVRAVPDTAVVMLSGVSRDEDLWAALRAGARGFLLKDTDPDRLPHALAGVMRGEAALPRTLTARLIEEFRTRAELVEVPTGPGGARLSERERDVLALMAAGLQTREIADRLGITAVTVRRHVSGAVQRLGVPDRAAAVAAIRSSMSPRLP
jgi:DNA-binding NarL/FixJ family response regulator